jgi:hypothetical protein
MYIRGVGVRMYIRGAGVRMYISGGGSLCRCDGRCTYKLGGGKVICHASPSHQT